MTSRAADFLHLDRVVHLAAGGQSPPLAGTLAALERYVQAKGAGLAGGRTSEAVRGRVAQKVAALVGATADDIGFPSSVAHGASLVADAVDWRPGDNVVMERWEFPSLMNPFLAQARHGVEVRTVAPEPGGVRAPIDRFAAAIDARTRVVALSHVSYLTGERHDLEAYAAVARKAGALFVVDASHALGSVRVHAPVADVLLGCCYKFLLGVHGVAIAYWNRARLPDWRPRLTGWHSTHEKAPFDAPAAPRALATGQVFEPGNPAYGAMYVLEDALDYLAAIGTTAIEAHTLAMSGDLRARFVSLGLPVMTPASARERAGSVAFASDDAPGIRARLENAGVLVSGDMGRVRASVHVYTTPGDLERAAHAIGAAVSGTSR